MKRVLLLLIIAPFIFLGCKDQNKEDVDDKTPVAEEELYDLEPDDTFNDIVTIFESIEQDPNYNSLLKLANQAQIIDDIKDLNDVTFFAPTNAAINKLSDQEYANLRLPQNMNRLQNILRYHIVEGEQDAATLMAAIRDNLDKPYRLQTIQGGYIALTLNDGDIIITDEGGSTSKVTEPNKEASDGVIHGVENLLLPNKQKDLN